MDLKIPIIAGIVGGTMTSILVVLFLTEAPFGLAVPHWACFNISTASFPVVVLAGIVIGAVSGLIVSKLVK